MSFGGSPFGSVPFAGVSGNPPALVSGFAPSRFGAPYVPIAESINTTRFGTPASIYARSIGPSLFGTPAGSLAFYAATLGPTSKFGQVYYPFTQTCEAAGFFTTRLGIPTATQRSPDAPGRKVYPQGFTTTQFGAPRAAVARTVNVTGFSTTKFGAPLYGRAKVATGFCTTRFGRPQARTVLNARHASGFSSTRFGTPTSTIRNRAASLGPTSRFGTPIVVRSVPC